MSVYKSASSLMATSVPRSVSLLVEPLSSLINQTQATPGSAVSMPSLSGLSCPGVGNYEDDSVVHFVMLSLTYEFWAIFQNFSQGGHTGPCRGWGMQPGSQGVGLSASNEPARQPQVVQAVAHDFDFRFGGSRSSGPTGRHSRQGLFFLLRDL